MRRIRAIAVATALELLGEPLLMLITLTALALTALAPALHYHQFGESSRMARDAGCSLLLLGGILYVAFGAFRTFRREIETGTMQVALAHSVSRSGFFLAKVVGCALGYLAYVLTVGAVTITVVSGAEIGGRIAAGTGGIARLWGPSLAVALAAVIVPLIVGAALNRLFRFRFTLSVSLLSLVVALAGIACGFDAALIRRLVPVEVLFAAPSLIVLSAVAAFSIRFGAGMTSLLSAIAMCLLVPALGNYCLSDALARGGSVPMGFFCSALAAIVPALVAFLALGIGLVNGRDAA